MLAHLFCLMGFHDYRLGETRVDPEERRDTGCIHTVYFYKCCRHNCSGTFELNLVRHWVELKHKLKTLRCKFLGHKMIPWFYADTPNQAEGYHCRYCGKDKYEIQEENNGSNK